MPPSAGPHQVNSAAALFAGISAEHSSLCETRVHTRPGSVTSDAGTPGPHEIPPSSGGSLGQVRAYGSVEPASSVPTVLTAASGTERDCDWRWHATKRSAEDAVIAVRGSRPMSWQLARQRPKRIANHTRCSV